MAEPTRSNPVIVVPAITASRLRDVYPVDPEIVWNVLRKDYDRTSLHPEDRRYERWMAGQDPARVLPDALFGIPYQELVEELRHNLTPRQDEPTPVYPFAYDWRQLLERSQAQLADMVDEVIDRTKLLRHYHSNRAWMDSPKVNLVAHSMGGLVVSGYLRDYGGQKIGKVATLGTPFRGSHEAILKVVTGTADLGVDSSSREREMARLTPALYHLLPDYPGSVVWDTGEPADLYETGTWQPGVVETIKEYVRMFGTEEGIGDEAARSKAKDILRELLVDAKRHRQGLNSATGLDVLGLQENSWLCIAGLGVETRVKLKIGKEGDTPVFDLSSNWRMNEWNKKKPDSVNTGDGTVPFLGACPTFLERRNMVCLCPDDFGYWEWGDRILSAQALAGFHGILPKMNLIHRLIVAHFTQNPQAKGIWGHRPPEVAEEDQWQPPIAGLMDKKLDNTELSNV